MQGSDAGKSKYYILDTGETNTEVEGLRGYFWDEWGMSQGDYSGFCSYSPLKLK